MDHRRALGQRARRRHRGDLLPDGCGLARQRRLVHLETLGLGEPPVGGHAVALPEDDEVAGDETVGRDPELVPAANDGGDGLHRAPQGEECSLRPKLLDEAQHRVEHDDRCDHARLEVLADRERDSGRKNQQSAQRVEELSRGEPHVSGALRPGKPVRSVRREARRGTLGGETVLEMTTELPRDCVRRACVRRGAAIARSAANARASRGRGGRRSHASSVAAAQAAGHPRSARRVLRLSHSDRGLIVRRPRRRSSPHGDPVARGRREAGSGGWSLHNDGEGSQK